MVLRMWSTMSHRDNGCCSNTYDESLIPGSGRSFLVFDTRVNLPASASSFSSLAAKRLFARRSSTLIIRTDSHAHEQQLNSRCWDKQIMVITRRAWNEEHGVSTLNDVQQYVQRRGKVATRFRARSRPRCYQIPILMNDNVANIST